jgi:hypothetical protein
VRLCLLALSLSISQSLSCYTPKEIGPEEFGIQYRCGAEAFVDSHIRSQVSVRIALHITKRFRKKGRVHWHQTFMIAKEEELAIDHRSIKVLFGQMRQVLDDHA